MLVQMGKGDLVIVGARPGMGKTSFAMNIATNVAKNSRKAAGRLQQSRRSTGIFLQTNCCRGKGREGKGRIADKEIKRAHLSLPPLKAYQ